MLKLVAYAANTGVFPDDPSIPDHDRWSMTDFPDQFGPDQPGGVALGTTMATLTPEGILHISDPDTQARRIYARYDTLNSTDNAIFEINCKLILSGESNGIAFGFIDTMKSLEVGLFASGSIFVIAKEGTQSAAFTTTDKFHTYRIIKAGAEKMEVYADSTPVFEIPYNQLADRTTEFAGNQRQVVSTSTPEPAEWDIAYVSYSISS